MKSLFLSALLLGAVSAQSLAGLPTCAYSCVTGAIPASCNLDPKCICEASSFIAGVTCCVAKVCDEADQEATLKYAKGICTPAGVTLTQTAAVCSSTAAGNSSMTATSGSSMSGTATGAAASASSSAASAGSSASSSLSSVISSASSAASSAAASAATSAAGAAQLVAQHGGNIFAAIVAAAALL